MGPLPDLFVFLGLPTFLTRQKFGAGCIVLPLALALALYCRVILLMQRTVQATLKFKEVAWPQGFLLNWERLLNRAV